MTPLAWLALATAGAIGAPLRYLVDSTIGNRAPGVFPWGTLSVNVTGSLISGFLTGLALRHGLADTSETVLVAGFCGAFTTFSTFSYETVAFLEQGAHREAIRNTIATLASGLTAATAGLALAAVSWG